MSLLRLYPPAWRERYEDEMRAVLEQHGLSLATRLSLLRGALDARIHHRRLSMDQRHRPDVGHSLQLAVLPSAFVFAAWVDSLLPQGAAASPNVFFLAFLVAWMLVCAWSGASVSRVRGSLHRGAAAGAITGFAAPLIAWVVGLGLFMAGADGVQHWAMSLQGLHGVELGSLGSYLAAYVNPTNDALLGYFAVGGCAAGACMGTIGGRLTGPGSRGAADPLHAGGVPRRC